MHDLRYRLCAGHTTAAGSQSVRGIFGLLLDDLGQAYVCIKLYKTGIEGRHGPGYGAEVCQWTAAGRGMKLAGWQGEQGMLMSSGERTCIVILLFCLSV